MSDDPTIIDGKQDINNIGQFIDPTKVLEKIKMLQLACELLAEMVPCPLEIMGSIPLKILHCQDINCDNCSNGLAVERWKKYLEIQVTK